MIAKRILIAVSVLGALLGITGCGSSHTKATAEAYQRWHDHRAQVLVALGEDQFDVGEFGKAYNSAKEALALSPRMVPARKLMVRVCIEKRSYGQAIAQLKIAAELAPGDGEVAYLRAVVHERRHQFEEALEAYEQARALAPTNAAYVVASAETLVTLDRTDEALELVESKLSELDATVDLLEVAGDLASRAGRADIAVRHYGQARNIDPENHDIQEKLAKAYFVAQQYEPAVGELKLLAKMKEFGERGWVHAMMADSYLALGKPREAKACFVRATELEPGNPRYWVGLAKSALAARDYARAVLSAREALSVDAEHSEAAIVLGFAYLKQGKAARAVEVLSRVDSKQPDQVMVKCLLGQSYDALGKPKQARQYYEAAQKLDPGNVIVMQLLADAEQ